MLGLHPLAVGTEQMSPHFPRQIGATQAHRAPLAGPTGPRPTQASSSWRLGACRSKSQLHTLTWGLKECENQASPGGKHRLPWSYTSMRTSPMSLVRRAWDIPQSWGTPISPEPSDPTGAQAPSSGTGSCPDLFSLTQLSQTWFGTIVIMPCGFLC